MGVLQNLAIICCVMLREPKISNLCLDNKRRLKLAQLRSHLCSESYSAGFRFALCSYLSPF